LPVWRKPRKFPGERQQVDAVPALELRLADPMLLGMMRPAQAY